MEAATKLKIYFLFFLLLIQLVVFAQDKNNTVDDHEFNLFLLILLVVFVCGMFGAAIAGSIAVTLVAILFFALIAVGVVSASVAVGVYKRSLSAGFKTFLQISFGVIYGITGATLAAFLQYNSHIAPSQIIATSCGLIGGVATGILLTNLTLKTMRYLISQAAARLKLRH